MSCMEYSKVKANILFFVGCFLYCIHLQAYPCYSLTKYSSNNGLSSMTIADILQDHKGQLWFATWNGLNKFDGYRFVSYKVSPDGKSGLSTTRLVSIAEDKLGYIWILTYDNVVCRFNPKTETFEQILDDNSSPYQILSVHVMKSGDVWLLVKGDGAVRVRTDVKTGKMNVQLYAKRNHVLSSEKVTYPYEDTNGNLWLLTDNGLFLEEKGTGDISNLFASDSQEGTSKQAFYTLLETEAEVLLGSEQGRIWRYLKRNGQMKLLQINTDSSVKCILAVAQNIWVIGTERDGFFIYNGENNGILQHYCKSNCPDLPSDNIIGGYVDKRNGIWLYTDALGTCRFDMQTEKLTYFAIYDEKGEKLTSQSDFNVYEDINDYLWVHPYGGGLSFYDYQTNQLIPFSSSNGDIKWKSSNRCYISYSDRQGNLWMCTSSWGLERFSFYKPHFNLFTPISKDLELQENDIRAIAIDSKGRLWTGNKNEEICVYDSLYHLIGKLDNNGNLITRTSRSCRLGKAYYIMEDSSKRIWIGTKGKGLICATPFDDDKFVLKYFNYEAQNIYSLSHDDVYNIFEDSKHRIWIATYGGGLNYMVPKKNGEYQFINYRNNMKNYPMRDCSRIRSISEDDIGNIWAGTTGGILTFNTNFVLPENIIFKKFASSIDNTLSLKSNDIHYVYFTTTGLYAVTYGGGFSKLVKEKDGSIVFKTYSMENGMPSDIVFSAIEDNRRHLWLVTENGLSKFDPFAEVFDNYPLKIQLSDVQFNEGVAVKNINGEIIINTNKGLCHFFPDSVSKSLYIPRIVFSNLSIGGEFLRPGVEGSPLTAELDDMPELVLSHHVNIFTIQYAALDMTGNENITYAYMLEGLDNTWKYVGGQRSVTYTNLKKGKYRLKIRSTNADGVWVENTRILPITILPSFWETGWAYFLYILSLCFFIAVFTYIFFVIYRLRNKVSMEQQIADIKLRFFTNISHELRTPLTLIIGPIEKILQKQLSQEIQDDLMLVKENTNRMLRLVNQLLDFRKVQNQKMKLKVSEVDLSVFIPFVMNNFKELSVRHHIDFCFETESEHLRIWIDQDKLETILFNLIANAFKFTPSGKSIVLTLKEEKNRVCIGVRDEGVGIEQEKQNVIFSRFETVMEKNLFNLPNTGIGLSLVKELVELHHGDIIVNSKIGQGTCFLVYFYKGKEHYSNEAVEWIVADFDKSTASDSIVQKVIQKGSLINEDKPVLLLVEDNVELRAFMYNTFMEQFNILEAADGEEGMNIAIEHIPDMIITDLMMPKMDGIAMIKKLRNNMNTSHIMIIMLTAKVDSETEFIALGEGADAYVTKPFSLNNLQVQVSNLLKRKVQLQEYYNHHLLDNQKSKEPELKAERSFSSNDKKFMHELIEFLNRNIDNNELLVDDLVSNFHMSRTVFFKKLKVLTGLSPVEFIREIRIKRAAELIKEDGYNMAQVAYMVGFNDPHYFSKCFKQVYNMTPTEYKYSVRVGT